MIVDCYDLTMVIETCIIGDILNENDGVFTKPSISSPLLVNDNGQA